jgi:exopolysaccharide biosynthesis polyprenyl glycosylphosphotransferase
MQAGRELPNLFRSSRGTQITSPAISDVTFNYRFATWVCKLTDVASAIASVVLAFLITNLNAMPADASGFLALRVSIKNLLLMAVFAFAWTGIFKAFGLYKARVNRDTTLRLLAATACGSLWALLFVFTSRAGAFKINALFLVWIFAAAMSIATRFVLRILTEPVPANRFPRQALIIGSGARALRLDGELTGRRRSEYQVLGFVDNAGARPLSEIQQRMVGDLSNLGDILLRNPVDEVLITLPVKSCYAEIQNAIEVCQRVGVECKYLSDIFQPSFAANGHERPEGFNVTSLAPVQHDARFVLKRLIDIVGAALGLAMLSPLLVIVAIAIKLADGGPILFSQERHGRNRRRFRMYKFRTMVNRAEELQPALELKNEVGGPVFKIREDPRVTRLGAILRRTSLDELPQLVNVLKGEMSLVGPRPLPERDVSRFEEAWLLRRFCVVPGLTGLWQVTARDSIEFEEWVRHDFDYIDNWSLRLDLQILVKTIPAVLKGVGAV